MPVSDLLYRFERAQYAQVRLFFFFGNLFSLFYLGRASGWRTLDTGSKNTSLGNQNRSALALGYDQELLIYPTSTMSRSAPLEIGILWRSRIPNLDVFGIFSAFGLPLNGSLFSNTVLVQ